MCTLVHSGKHRTMLRDQQGSYCFSHRSSVTHAHKKITAFCGRRESCPLTTLEEKALKGGSWLLWPLFSANGKGSEASPCPVFTHLDPRAAADTRRRPVFSESATCSQWPNWQKMKINKLKNLLFRNMSKENMTSRLLPNLPPIAPLTLCLVKWKGVFKRGKETSAWTLEISSKAETKP